MQTLLSKRQSPSTENSENQYSIQETNREQSNLNIDHSAHKLLLITTYPKLLDMVD
jgi:hypothetical protein